MCELKVSRLRLQGLGLRFSVIIVALKLLISDSSRTIAVANRITISDLRFA